ncbi:hypothetical protein FWD20_03270 [Candidatus Saccharibacteria bacterium]|nr:hypothetical protein [Candidatus Saccharibacteria bacterium]
MANLRTGDVNRVVGGALRGSRRAPYDYGNKPKTPELAKIRGIVARFDQAVSEILGGNHDRTIGLRKKMDDDGFERVEIPKPTKVGIKVTKLYLSSESGELAAEMGTYKSVPALHGEDFEYLFPLLEEFHFELVVSDGDDNGIPKRHACFTYKESGVSGDKPAPRVLQVTMDLRTGEMTRVEIMQIGIDEDEEKRVMDSYEKVITYTKSQEDFLDDFSRHLERAVAFLKEEVARERGEKTGAVARAARAARGLGALSDDPEE